MESRDGFVLDCSVTMAWCFDDEATPYTDGVRDSLADVRAVVPSIWPLETANATIVGERRGRLDEARSRRFFVLLEALPIRLDEETGDRAFGDIVHLARTYPCFNAFIFERARPASDLGPVLLRAFRRLALIRFALVIVGLAPECLAASSI